MLEGSIGYIGKLTYGLPWLLLGSCAQSQIVCETAIRKPQSCSQPCSWHAYVQRLWPDLA
jgi:hypothetical protein